MCWRCFSNSNISHPEAPFEALPGASSRRGFLNHWGLGLGFAAMVHANAEAQVDVGQSSSMRKLVPAESLEQSARQQYRQTLGEANSKGALAPDDYPQLKRLRAIANRLIPFTAQWNPDARKWKWEVNLIGSKQLNAWCMLTQGMCHFVAHDHGHFIVCQLSCVPAGVCRACSYKCATLGKLASNS
jgi:hypothetical protein